MELEAVIFDLDNTLIDRDAAALRFARALLTPRHAWEEVRPCFVSLDGGGHADRLGLWRGVLERFPVPGLDAEGAWARMRAEIADHVRPAPEAAAVLERLRARGLRLALLSDGSSGNQRRKLLRSGLAECFGDAVVISAEIGAEKPAREAFEAALEAADAEASAAMMVGDHPERDVAGAAALGMRTAWLARGRAFPYTDWAPDLTLETLSELPAALSGIEATRS